MIIMVHFWQSRLETCGCEGCSILKQWVKYSLFEDLAAASVYSSSCKFMDFIDYHNLFEIWLPVNQLLA